MKRRFSVLLSLLAALSACKSQQPAAALKNVVGIDADGVERAMALLPVVNRLPLQGAGSYAVALVATPFFALVDCQEYRGVGAADWQQLLAAHAAGADLEIDEGRRLSITGANGNREVVPCRVTGTRLVDYATIAAIFASATAKSPDAASLLVAQAMYLSLRGFHVDGKPLRGNETFVTLARLAQDMSGSRPAELGRLEAKLATLDERFNPCRLGRGETLGAFSCVEVASGLFGFKPGGHRAYADVKSALVRRVAETYAEVHAGDGVGPVTALWNSLSDTQPNPKLPAGLATLKAPRSGILAAFDYEGFLSPRAIVSGTGLGLERGRSRPTIPAAPRVPALRPLDPTMMNQLVDVARKQGGRGDSKANGKPEAQVTLDEARFFDQLGKLAPLSATVEPGTSLENGLKFEGTTGTAAAPYMILSDRSGNYALYNPVEKDPARALHTFHEEKPGVFLRTDTPHAAGDGRDGFGFYEIVGTGGAKEAVKFRGQDHAYQLDNRYDPDAGTTALTAKGAEELRGAWAESQTSLFESRTREINQILDGNRGCPTAMAALKKLGEELRSNNDLVLSVTSPDSQAYRQSLGGFDRARFEEQDKAFAQRYEQLQAKVGAYCRGRRPINPDGKASGLRLDGADDDCGDAEVAETQPQSPEAAARETEVAESQPQSTEAATRVAAPETGVESQPADAEL